MKWIKCRQIVSQRLATWRRTQKIMLNETEHVPWIEALNKMFQLDSSMALWLSSVSPFNLWQWAGNELDNCALSANSICLTSQFACVNVMQLPDSVVVTHGDQSERMIYWESLTGMILQSFRPASAVLDWPIESVGLATNNLQASYVLELNQKLTKMDMSLLFQSFKIAANFIHLQHTKEDIRLESCPEVHELPWHDRKASASQLKEKTKIRLEQLFISFWRDFEDHLRFLFFLWTWFVSIAWQSNQVGTCPSPAPPRWALHHLDPVLPVQHKGPERINWWTLNSWC